MGGNQNGSERIDEEKYKEKKNDVNIEIRPWEWNVVFRNTIHRPRNVFSITLCEYVRVCGMFIMRYVYKHILNGCYA